MTQSVDLNSLPEFKNEPWTDFSVESNRKAMEAAGLKGGYSRLPSRDEVITTELREAYKKLLEEFRTG